MKRHFTIIVIVMNNRCRVTVNDNGVASTITPSIVKQLCMSKVGTITSREYTRSQKINDFAVLFSHEENYHYGLIEKFIVTPQNVIKAVVTVLNGHSNFAPHIKKYRNPISK